MTIYILALHGVATGGPEATHQLSDALIDQGFDARMVYFRWEDFAQGFPPTFPEYGGFAPEYARYQINLARSIPDEEGSVVVLPETLATAAVLFKHAKVLIWWLSVDFGLGQIAQLNLNRLRAPNIYHASQSRYAEKFVEALQFQSLGMLSDYTADLSEYAKPLLMSERPKLVAFNARPDKVVADLDAIVAEVKAMDPEIACVGISGMSRADVAQTFAMARVYVDLGNFPGKDRLPREAASMGCVPLVAAMGAGRTDLQKYAMRSNDDAAVTIVRVANEPEGPGACASSERETFFREVREVFARLI